MRTTMPEWASIHRIGGAVPATPPARTRLDVSAAIGLDVTLVLGPVGGDADELAEYTRLSALVDMADAGAIPNGADLDRITLDLVAGLVEDMESDDNRRGFEDDEFAGRWAA
ncbi:hypothetical protein [Streptomyces violascens]|uniref:hypothetical protein n=1 Tax=Streptomyces violascens TaxID=67381 RepID=UPI00167469D1|nr:hypothetical protein [Streptomyces violascens]GGU51257.1 hypothetical protein GCM10010289_84620 [Streptomyces violascens]